jgi:hypothetical protein
LSRRQFDLNPPNPLSHTSSNSYPCKPLSGSLSNMYNQRDTKMYEGEIISLTQSQKHYSLKDNDLK